MTFAKSNYSSEDFREITPSDSVDMASQPRALIAAGAGLAQCVRPDGTVVPIYLAAGAPVSASPVRINATGTTATGIVGLW